MVKNWRTAKVALVATATALVVCGGTAAADPGGSVRPPTSSGHHPRMQHRIPAQGTVGTVTSVNGANTAGRCGTAANDTVTASRVFVVPPRTPPMPGTTHGPLTHGPLTHGPVTPATGAATAVPFPAGSTSRFGYHAGSGGAPAGAPTYGPPAASGHGSGPPAYGLTDRDGGVDTHGTAGRSGSASSAWSSGQGHGRG